MLVLLREKVVEQLEGVHGIIVPGGFGSRGAEGKIKAINYARENNVPFLGLCFGMQLAVMEFARNVCGIEDANSTEINLQTKNLVIDILPEQKDIEDKGGTMRLGAYTADVIKGSKVFDLYKSSKVSERHRHRYEVNPEYHNVLKDNGLIFAGTSQQGRLVEFIELPKLDYFIATQAHPELKSSLEKPAPLFYGFMRACLD
jgi:CTP synthase